MNPDKQRIAIAEACGWKIWDYPRENCMYRYSAPIGTSPWLGRHALPDYLNDLNAMRAAEATLKPARRHYYLCELERVLGYQTGPGGWDMDEESMWAMVHATAGQRAEAFLRTIGKWERA